MKVIAVILTVVTLLAVIFCGYVVYTSNASVTGTEYQVSAAADRLDLLAAVRQADENDDEKLIMYSDISEEDIDQLIFVTYTIHLKNRGILPYEWFDISLAAKTGDLAVLKYDIDDVPARGEGSISITILTDRSSNDYTRQATVGYFFYGHEKRFLITLGRQ